MAKAWIEDRWVRDATVTLPDGSTQKISPTSQQLKSLKSLPDHFRTAKFGSGSRWATRWYEDEGGVQKSRQKTFKKRTDAEEFAAELEDDIRTGRYVDPSHRERPFEEVAEIWLGAKNRLKGSTYRRYERELRNYVLPRWSGTQIGAIRREHIDEWVKQLRDGTAEHSYKTRSKDKKVKAMKPLAPAYIHHLVGVTFGGTIRYAVAEGWISRNPLQNVELPRDESEESDLPTLTYQEVEALADAAEKLTKRTGDAVLVKLLAYCGPRIGEATALRVSDLDLVRGRAKINRTWTIDREGLRRTGPPKTWQRREIPLPSFLVSDLKTITEGKDDDEYVFQSSRGGAINDRNWYNRVWVKIRDGVGIGKGFSIHDLRHVAATLSIAAGADVKLVQQMLGHKDATETLNTYSHLWPDKIAEVVDLVEARRARALAA